MEDRREERVLLAHGGGGILMRELVSQVIEKLGGQGEGPLQDSAVLTIDSGRVAFTTDSFVVSPLFFPGGDIGSLAVFGTVNDLAVSGAIPRFISLAMIIEEGLPMATVERIVDSIHHAAQEARVTIVTGDTKVVENGKADGIFINTTGIGLMPDGIELSSAFARPGDLVIVNGPIGEHGLAILSHREGIEFGSDLRSDTAPISNLTVPLLEKTSGIRAMRDATRGGLAAVLNEIASDSGVCIRIEEETLPITDAVRKGCELMGYDPLHIANEGKFVTIVDKHEAGTVLEIMKANQLGAHASVIGEVQAKPAGHVILKTELGGERVVDIPYGDLLPRIC